MHASVDLLRSDGKDGFRKGSTYARLTRPYRTPIAFGVDSEIEKGYESDGASIPWYLWPIVGHPMDGQLVGPALVHDKLCELSMDYEDRKIADAVFAKLLRLAGVGRFRRSMMYLAVRCCGWNTWRKRRGQSRG